jgi:hypothetical protein
MAIQRSIALALIVGLVGLLVGRALPRVASKTEVTASVKPMPPVPFPTNHDCKAERAEHSSINAQLALCKAYLGRAPQAAPSTAPDPEPKPHTFRVKGLPAGWQAEHDQMNENRQRLATYPEAVVVFHPDGVIRVYRTDEWPSDGDGQILARKFLDGHVGWYAGKDAGPRSDPAAFRPRPPAFIEPVWGTLPDGTITINGVEADPAVQEMFGTKRREAGR